MKYIYCYKTEFGEIGIIEQHNAIVEVRFNEARVMGEIIVSETSLIHQAYEELMEYLQGKREKFEVPLLALGTPFQQKVWKALQSIPYGETRSYKDIAKQVKTDKAYRAIGTAARRNPLPIFIPCHRVISSTGNLSGYILGTHIKENLLNIEKQDQ